MSYEPRGKMIELMAAVRADPAKVFKAPEVAAILCCKNFPSTIDQYLFAATASGLIFKRRVDGIFYYAGSPVSDELLKKSGIDVPPPGASSGSRMMPSPTYSPAEIAAARADVRAPKTDPGWTPPKMIATRPGSESNAPPQGKREAKLDSIRTDIAAEMEPRSDRGNRVLLGKLKTSLPHWDAGAENDSGKGTPSAAPPPAPTRTLAPEPQPEQPAAEQEGEAVEFNAALWLDGDLVLYGLTELEDGGHMIAGENLAKLRKLLAWMPC